MTVEPQLERRTVEGRAVERQLVERQLVVYLAMAQVCTHTYPSLIVRLLELFSYSIPVTSTVPNFTPVIVLGVYIFDQQDWQNKNKHKIEGH